MKALPINLREAKEFIDQHHRHHKAPSGWKFGIGAEIDGELIGVVVVGRPVARMLDDGKTAEVTRLCTLGHKNACSFLYSRAARAAKAMGYERVITYILESESGSSLKASGWKLDAEGVGGGSWNRPQQGRLRIDKHPTGKKQRWVAP